MKSYVLLGFVPLSAVAFCVVPHVSRTNMMLSSRRQKDSLIALHMGKGLNSFRNKQAELKRKMEIAKQQKEIDGEEVPVIDDVTEKTSLTDIEIKEQNDRLRFQELLKRSASNVLNNYSSDGYLSKDQEEEEIEAARAGVDRLFEGDPAPVDCFEEIVNIKSENAIGRTGKERLVPWLRKNPDRQRDYLIVLTDPRPKSDELRETINSLVSTLPSDILSRMIVINADSPSENRRWLKKSGFDEKIDVYSDEKQTSSKANNLVIHNSVDYLVEVLGLLGGNRLFSSDSGLFGGSLFGDNGLLRGSLLSEDSGRSGGVQSLGVRSSGPVELGLGHAVS